MEWLNAILIKITVLATSVLISVGLVPVPQDAKIDPVATSTPQVQIEVVEVKETSQEPIPTAPAVVYCTTDCPQVEVPLPSTPPVIIIVPSPQTQEPTPPPASAPVVESPQMPDPTPIKIFKLKYEGGDFADIYYWGDKKLVSATVNGVAAEFKQNQSMEGNCIWLWDYPGGNRTEKVCGGHMARIVAPFESSNVVVLTAEDGTTHEGTVIVEQ